MFVSNMIVNVYRQDGAEDAYSEYDVESESLNWLVYRRMPIHITPYRPRTSDNSVREGQWTTHTANIRRNYELRRGDTLVSPEGRRFEVDTIEPTGGAFMDNSVILDLIERDAAP